MKKRIGTLIIVVLVLLFAWMGFDYLHYRSVNAVSDAAFIKSDRVALLSFKVDGKLIATFKEENEAVKKGELLAVMDARDFNVTKQRLLHELAALKAETEALKRQRARLVDTLALKARMAGTDVEALTRRADALRYRIEAGRKRLKKLTDDKRRYADMLEKRLIAEAEYEKVATARAALADEIAAMEKELAALTSQLDKAKEAKKVAVVQKRTVEELTMRIRANEQKSQALNKQIEAIEDKIAYTRLYAPFDGAIAKRFAVAPRVMESGTPVYALADTHALYCEVLLSEKKLHGVKPGNEATVKVDAVKGRTYRGTVESIAPTSAATFSLVPRDIASGEFTKLDQRFVVRIKLRSHEGLRAGMGATVAIKRGGES